MVGVAQALSGAESSAVTSPPPLTGETRADRAGARAKRTLDVVLSALLLVALLPLMALIGLAVAVSSAGPVIYRQARDGMGQRSFTMLKFRTMHHNSAVDVAALLLADGSEMSICTKPRHDPRITPVGRFLRKTSLDELPQLINVLRGDMSLVGPRPNVRPENQLLHPEHRARRLSVKPGMTGLWQVSGRSSTTVDEAIRLDLRYVDHWSLQLDLLILLRTLPAVLRTSNAR
ncbi:sugar transferase [Streptomyces sp. NPDC059680]|uniref:sugar transferase n=1 Tax=Streptomyces sp. NPDC059680 TaxID=3346904 RepID=UPI0036B489BE